MKVTTQTIHYIAIYLHKQISEYECSICRERGKILVIEVFCFLFVVQMVLTKHVSEDFVCSQINLHLATASVV